MAVFAHTGNADYILRELKPGNFDDWTVDLKTSTAFCTRQTVANGTV
jgi:hypothetical protein